MNSSVTTDVIYLRFYVEKLQLVKSTTVDQK